jgi:hypothetical protein
VKPKNSRSDSGIGNIKYSLLSSMAEFGARLGNIKVREVTGQSACAMGKIGFERGAVEALEKPGVIGLIVRQK